jgi:hypothetical protein
MDTRVKGPGTSLVRRYAFTSYAVVASLFWIGLLIAGDSIHATVLGRSYLAVTRILIIPLYLLQTLFAMAVVALRGEPLTSHDSAVIRVSLGVAQWLFSILPFHLIDRWRARRTL